MTKKRKVSNSKLSNQKTLVDIVIPVYGQFDYLQRCMDSIPIAAQKTPYKVILVDNDSPDDLTSFPAKDGTYTHPKDVFYSQYKQNPNVKILYNKSNLGFSMACNRGAKSSYSPLIFFLNTDVVLDPGSIDTLVCSMDNPEVGIAGMKLVFPPTGNSNDPIRPAGKVQHVGIFTNIRGDVFHIFVGWDENNPKVTKIDGDVYAVTGAALLVRRNLFSKAGGFFEGYGMGCYEDIDLCMSIREMGYNIVVNQSARATHYTGRTSEAYRIQFPLNYNRLIFMNRWATKLQHTDWSKW